MNGKQQLQTENENLKREVVRANKLRDQTYKRLKDLLTKKGCSASYEDYFNIAYNEVMILLLNAVKIDGVKFTEANFIKKRLFCGGVVGYDKDFDKWLYVSGQDINGYNFPVYGIFQTANGSSYQKKISYDAGGGAYYIVANEMRYALTDTINSMCQKIAETDVSIMQNIRAVRVPRFIATDEETEHLKLSLSYASEQIQEGVPVVKISSAMGKALQSIDLNVELIAGQLLEIQDNFRNSLLSRLGILTANSNKKERVQVGEINAHIGECVDNIYTVIDCFNAQMKDYELPFKMSLNGSIEDLYAVNTDAPTQGDSVTENQGDKGGEDD